MSKAQAIKARPSRKRTGRGSNQKEVARFAGDAYSLAERAYKGVSHVLKLINIETKFIDYNFTPAFSSTPSALQISIIPQGVDMGQRLGDSIKLQRLLLNFTVHHNVITIPQVCRIMLVRDNESTGAAPSYLDVIAYPSVVCAPLNYFNRNRFAILYDEVFVVEPATFTGLVCRKEFEHNGHIKWRTNATTLASLAEGHIYAFFFTDSGVTYPSCNFNLRLLYTDD